MHNQNAAEFTRISGEISSLYHEAAVRIGVSDSVLDILYVLGERDGRCLQSQIFKSTGISRQTINSAIRKLEKDDIVRLEQGAGRNTIVCITEKGKKLLEEKIYPLFEIEDKVWNEWTPDEQQQYLLLTQIYRDGLKKYMKDF